VHQPRRGHVLGRDNGTRQEASKPHAAEGRVSKRKPSRG